MNNLFKTRYSVFILSLTLFLIGCKQIEEKKETKEWQATKQTQTALKEASEKQQYIPDPNIEFVFNDTIKEEWANEDLVKFKNIVSEHIKSSVKFHPSEQLKIMVQYDSKQLSSFGSSGKLISWYEHEINIVAKDATNKEVLKKAYKGEVDGAYTTKVAKNGNVTGIQNTPVNYSLVLKDVDRRMATDPLDQ